MTETPTTRDLRRRWKPTKDGPASDPAHEPVRIRIHRCLSWLTRVEDLDEAEIGADDTRLIFRWTALNSLYGRWDHERQEPHNDRESLDGFLRIILDADKDRLIPEMLKEHRKLAESLVGDEYLNRYFWSDPSEGTTRRAQNGIYKLREAIREDRMHAALDQTLRGIYLARCQLVHGAATFDGKLNRTAVRRCAIFLGHLLPAILVVIIDHAWEDNWDGLCYPPST